jgi:hypothetical protein
MADPRDTTEDLQAQVLDGIRKSQEAVIDGMRSWAETMQQLVPGAGQAAFARGNLPTPTEVVDSVFDFAAQLLDAQRELAHTMLGATASIGEQVQEETSKATERASERATDRAKRTSRTKRR